MSEWDFARSVSSMRLLTQLGLDHGLSVNTCLVGTGLTEPDLADASLTVSARHELRLIQNLKHQDRLHQYHLTRLIQKIKGPNFQLARQKIHN